MFAVLPMVCAREGLENEASSVSRALGREPAPRHGLTASFESRTRGAAGKTPATERKPSGCAFDDIAVTARGSLSRVTTRSATANLRGKNDNGPRRIQAAAGPGFAKAKDAV